MTAKEPTGQCPYCINPMREHWVTQCWYSGTYKTHADFVESTFDPPCAGDAYDRGQEELARQQRRMDILGTLTGLAIVILFFSFIYWVGLRDA